MRLEDVTVVIVPGLRDHVAEHWQTLLARQLPRVRTVAPLSAFRRCGTEFETPRNLDRSTFEEWDPAMDRRRRRQENKQWNERDGCSDDRFFHAFVF